jgi:hypothetical protein
MSAWDAAWETACNGSQEDETDGLKILHHDK